MCCSKLQKSKNRCKTWLNQPVHPLWLRSKDKEAMEEFTKARRAMVAKVYAWAAAMHWVFALVFVCMKYDSIGEQGLFFVQFMSITGSMTVITVMYKFIPVSMDFSCMFLIGVRIVITFVLFNLVDSDNPAFQAIDRK